MIIIVYKMSINTIDVGILNQDNNKFGICCGCSSLGHAETLFTNYKSSSIFNDEIQKKNNIINSNEYRSALQMNAEKIMSNEQKKYEMIRCNPNKSSNIFYIDSSRYNFIDPLTNEYKGQSMLNHGIKGVDHAKF